MSDLCDTKLEPTAYDTYEVTDGMPRRPMNRHAAHMRDTKESACFASLTILPPVKRPVQIQKSCTSKAQPRNAIHSSPARLHHASPWERSRNGMCGEMICKAPR